MLQLSRDDLMEVLRLAQREGAPTVAERRFVARVALDLQRIWDQADRDAAEAKRKAEAEAREAEQAAEAARHREEVRAARKAEWLPRAQPSPNPGQNGDGQPNPHAPTGNDEIDATTLATDEVLPAVCAEEPVVEARAIPRLPNGSGG